jgi:hypothetical protein
MNMIEWERSSGYASGFSIGCGARKSVLVKPDGLFANVAFLACVSELKRVSVYG